MENAMIFTFPAPAGTYYLLKCKINTIDNLFSEIIQIYRKEDNPGVLEQYIDDMDSFVKENKLQEEEITEDFILFYGDTIMDINLDNLMTFHKKNGGIATFRSFSL